MTAGVAVGVYAAITALLFANLLPVVTTHIYADLGDPLLNAAILAWNARHVPLTPEWWNFPSFAPLSGVTAFTEHLLAAYPLATPIVWATGNAILAYNVVLLAAFLLNGWAAYLLAREATGSSIAAFVAGLAFAFAPYHSVQLSHLQTLLAFGMPLALLGLHRYLRSGALPSLLLFGLGWLITALSNAYMLVFFPLLVVLWCVWFIRPREWWRLIAPVVTAALFALPLIPLLTGYRTRLEAYGFRRELDEIRSFSADMIGLIGISHREWLWRGILPNTLEESALFPGLAIALLAVAGLGSRLQASTSSPWPRRIFFLSGAAGLVAMAIDPYRMLTAVVVVLIAAAMATPEFRQAWMKREPVVFYAIAVVVLWLFALGPMPEWSAGRRGLVYGPYYLFSQIPVLASSIRVPARAWLPAALCLSVVAGAGAAWLWQRRRVLVVLCAAAIVAEGWFIERPALAPPPMTAGVIPPGAMVLDLPVEEGFWNATPQYRAVLGGYRTLNGYSGYEPPHFQPMRRAVADLHVNAFNPYLALDDVYVIVRAGTPEPVRRFIAGYYDSMLIHQEPGLEVYRLPRIDPNAPRARVPIPLPRPGARPFGMY